jgi:hypothetical protein
MVVRDVLPHSSRSLAAAGTRFNLVGLHWQGEGTPWFRTRGLDGRWTGWEAADDDWGRVGVWRRSNPVWTGGSDAIQVRTKGAVTRVREYLLWSPPIRESGRRLQISGAPAIVSRAGWQADEAIRRAPPRYASTLRLAVVHHTATATAYSCSQSASIVRGIEVYHVKGNGWDDIGYNFLVDACGRIFEGRYGGIEKNVIGAHSQGFNTGSVGVALIGNYGRATPSRAEQDAVVHLLAWRLDVAHVDPLSFVTYNSGGNAKFRAGMPVNLRAISGHRDTYLTECPGAALYRLLPSIAARVAKTGLPKLYAPIASGTLGGQIRFTARLSAPLPWTVTVSDAAGVVAARGAGVGPGVDWTWDSRLAVLGAAYTWTISAGDSVRAAVGVLGGKLAALTLTDLQISPPMLDGAVVPNATVSYSLGNTATVTADLIAATGEVETLFSQSKNAGPQSFLFTPIELSDGNYTIRLTARDMLGRQVQASVPVAVSHAVLAFSADGKLVSPNGDGRHDSVVFTFVLTQPVAVALSAETNLFSFPLLSAQLAPGTQTFAFTGTAADGTTVQDGVYRAQLAVNGVTVSLPLAIDRAPAVVSLVSVKPLRLRVAERVTVIATVNGRVIRASKGPGVFALARGETVRTLSVVARDAAGNESAPVTYPRR